ncbi:uncharacterized protein DUF1127 [Phyllobacterium brassicacearum]|nr:uncharacterized protein DUF1127 [Phyllobacterium brassicacearum]
MAYLDFNVARRLGQLLSDLAVSVQRQRTRRYVNDLPEHILKDIGWPAACAERSGDPSDRTNAGIWASACDANHRTRMDVPACRSKDLGVAS